MSLITKNVLTNYIAPIANLCFKSLRVTAGITCALASLDMLRLTYINFATNFKHKMDKASGAFNRKRDKVENLENLVANFAKTIFFSCLTGVCYKNPFKGAPGIAVIPVLAYSTFRLNVYTINDSIFVKNLGGVMNKLSSYSNFLQEMVHSDTFSPVLTVLQGDSDRENKVNEWLAKRAKRIIG